MSQVRTTNAQFITARHSGTLRLRAVCSVSCVYSSTVRPAIRAVGRTTIPANVHIDVRLIYDVSVNRRRTRSTPPPNRVLKRSSKGQRAKNLKIAVTYRHANGQCNRDGKRRHNYERHVSNE